MNDEVIRLTMVVENMGDENRALTGELARVKQECAGLRETVENLTESLKIAHEVEREDRARYEIYKAEMREDCRKLKEELGSQHLDLVTYQMKAETAEHRCKEEGARSAFEMSIEIDIPKWVDEPQRSEQVASELEAAMVAWRKRESRQEFSTKAAAFSDVVKELAKDDK